MAGKRTHCDEFELLSRRAFLRSRWIKAGIPDWMPEIRLADPHAGPRGDTLVCIFLRGGADGLNIVVPHGDNDYYRHRPTLGIARPDDRGAEHKTIDLDGFFGLHPALSRLAPIYEAGDLACIQATGSPDESRSHFKAMAEMERASFGGGAYSGWLARHLATYDTGNRSALRAVAIGEMLPASLSGAAATALRSPDAFRLDAPAEAATVLKSLYAGSEGAVAEAATQTFDTLEALRLAASAPAVESEPAYPESDFGKAMATIARLIKIDVGVEVACVDLGNWDTHAAQGAGEGLMAGLLTDLGNGLAAFYEDTQPRMGDITVVVMSEFGRRVQENGALGTDHGHGNMMLLAGGGINGKTVYARWPGLQVGSLFGPGDLSITTDYRDVLAEITRKRLNNPRLEEVFPGYAAEELGVAAARTL